MRDTGKLEHPARIELLARLAAKTGALNIAQIDQWEALLAADDDGASLTELGTAMGIPRQTVRWRLRAARREIRNNREKQR